MKRANVNYWIDITTGIAFVLSALSGLIFLLPLNPATEPLGMSYRMWSNVHTWSSLAAIAGVGIHLVLHWKWMVAMTKRMLSSGSRQEAKELASDMAYGGTQGKPISRRAFLIFGGTAAVVVGAIVAGYKAISSQGNNYLPTAKQENESACPFGLINDPYPGRCGRYLDLNGDGICDYSVPGSEVAISTSEETEPGSRYPGRRRRGWGQP